MSSMGEKEIVAAFVESLNRVSNKELFQMLSPRCKQAREDTEHLGEALKMNNVAENIRIAIYSLSWFYAYSRGIETNEKVLGATFVATVPHLSSKGTRKGLG